MSDPYISLNETTTIKVFWDNHFGKQNVAPLHKVLSALIHNRNVEDYIYESFMDPKRTGFISYDRFYNLVKGMGPLDQFLDNIADMDIKYTFYGYLSTDEANYMLHKSNEETFLIRMSQTSDHMVISCIHNNNLENYRLEPNNHLDIYGWLFKGDVMVLDDIIKSMPHLLKNHPKMEFTMPHYICPWVTSSQQAVNILSMEEVGSFFVRLASQKDCFVISVKNNEGVQHYVVPGTNGGVNRDWSINPDQIRLIVSHVENHRELLKVGISVLKHN